MKTDTHAKERTYTQTYALTSPAGVKALLRDRHRIAARRERGDYAASDILIDLHSAIESAALTDRQAEAIAWVYGADVTQAEAARIMVVSQPTVNQALDAAAERIAEVYERWNYGAVSVEISEETEDSE